jgi:hypothetical protein
MLLCQTAFKLKIFQLGYQFRNRSRPRLYWESLRVYCTALEESTNFLAMNCHVVL